MNKGDDAPDEPTSYTGAMTSVRRAFVVRKSATLGRGRRRDVPGAEEVKAEDQAQCRTSALVTVRSGRSRR
jgi:hypothetical protein